MKTSKTSKSNHPMDSIISRKLEEIRGNYTNFEKSNDTNNTKQGLFLM